MKVTLLAGGTGGTKLAHGFTLLDPPVELTVIANVGDDFELHGLHVSPDVDALLYTLGGLIDADRGWGIRGDTMTAHAMLERYGEPGWFAVGDADLATHVERTRRLRSWRVVDRCDGRHGDGPRHRRPDPAGHRRPVPDDARDR